MQLFADMKWTAFLVLLCSACSSDGATYPSSPSVTTPVTGAKDAGIKDAAPSGKGGSSSTAPPSGGCDVTPVTKCPSPKPSYKNDVIPILQARCYGCHSNVDGSGPWPLTTLVDIQDWKTQFIQDVTSCAMPPLDAGAKLSSDDAKTILGWLVCGAPGN